MASIELAARRGVDHCVKLLKSSHLAPSEVIDDARNNRSRHIQMAGEQLDLFRSQLKMNINHWIQTGTFSGLLSSFVNEKMIDYFQNLDQRMVDDLPEPMKTVVIPALDMSGLRIETPNDSGRTQTPRTPIVSDIGSYQEVLEVSDSSAVDSQPLDVDQKKGNVLEIPTISVKNPQPLPRSSKMDFGSFPLQFIPSVPLKEKRTITLEAAVQTQREDAEKTDAATSYSSQHFQDVGEISTSETSDPSLGQVDLSRISPDKVISVLIDGSLLQRKVIREEEEEWRAPLELVRIAEKDISSSFGSEEIETLSAKGANWRGQRRRSSSEDSDEEPTTNQVSGMDSDGSGRRPGLY